MSLSHIQIAHSYWKNFICKGDHVIDATCGNGHDALALAKMVLTEESGSLICLDKQSEAIKNTNALLKENLPSPLFFRVSLHHMCHSTFPITTQPVKLIVYNLGYLPRGDKKITTNTESTLMSLEKGLNLLTPNGVISITCYPGHEEGNNEEKAIVEWISTLHPNHYVIYYTKRLHRINPPSLLLIQKII